MLVLVAIMFFNPLLPSLHSEVATNNFLPLKQDLYLSIEDQKELIEKSKKGDGSAAFRLAQYFTLYVDDPKQGLTWLKRGEELGHSVSGLNLAFYYRYDLQPPDYKTSFEICQKWAKRGNADAMIAVGEMLEGGQGIPKDQGEAMKWYEKAAHAGKVFTMEKLSSKLLEDGNIFEAYIWSKVGSLRRKRVGAKNIKQSNPAELAKKLTAEQLGQAKKNAAKLDKEIPFIEPWTSW